MEQWIAELDEDATFNFTSYGECFISENLLRKYIREKSLDLSDKKKEIENGGKLLKMQRIQLILVLI